ncbi:TPA: glycosyltransferase family 4 protein [Candidatus Micrarchaeota archaeon]|nr:glycosyltransferase family 4 protein [Candidatus Micrarchaeota archaeon]HII09629.1 glycosyltransferase family 4 protein [Candidatus Micrarchaeota archaeon]
MLNPYFYPYKGGTEKVLLEVYSRLAKRNNVTVITSVAAKKNKPSVEEISGIRVVRLKASSTRLPTLPMPFLIFDGLKKALVREKSDIYHINNRYQYFGDTVRIVKGMDRKLALTVHNAIPRNINFTTDELGRFYDWFWGKKLMGAVDVITAVSTNTAKTTIPRRYMKKAHVIFNGVDFKRFRKMRKDSAEVESVVRSLGFRGTTIVTNGRLVPQKGQIYLLDAFAELVNSGMDELNLLVIGRGALSRHLYRSAKKMGVAKKFRIVSGIEDAMLPCYYNACDIFAFPSLYEPAGLAVCEAMSCELPVVASNVGGIPEIVGDCGIYSKPKDYESIRDGLGYIIGNDRAVRHMVRMGRERMVRRHNWDRIAKQYENLFSGVVRR